MGLSLGPFEYGYQYRLSRSEREHDCNPALIAGATLDPVLPSAGPDVFLGRHDDCSRPANRYHVVHREAVVPQFVPEMPRVDHGSVFDAYVELRFRRRDKLRVHVSIRTRPAASAAFRKSPSRLARGSAVRLASSR